ncbi:MAG: hypothetical protein K6U80_02065 [Firmicutes bacterium]|nr:hypothetical protein [Bacillota bacterium]
MIQLILEMVLYGCDYFKLTSRCLLAYRKSLLDRDDHDPETAFANLTGSGNHCPPKFKSLRLQLQPAAFHERGTPPEFETKAPASSRANNFPPPEAKIAFLRYLFWAGRVCGPSFLPKINPASKIEIEKRG